MNLKRANQFASFTFDLIGRKKLNPRTQKTKKYYPSALRVIKMAIFFIIMSDKLHQEKEDI